MPYDEPELLYDISIHIPNSLLEYLHFRLLVFLDHDHLRSQILLKIEWEILIIRIISKVLRNFTIHRFIVILLSLFFMPHFENDTACEQSSSFQIPWQGADVWRSLKTSCLNPFILETMFRRLRAVDQRSWLENADFVFISCCDFPCVCTTVKGWYSDVIMNGARNDLHSFECACKDDNVTACCVCLKSRNNYYEEGKQ